jgi:transmembrane sensor
MGQQPMTADPPPDDGLFEEALDILIRLQNAPANPVTLELIRHWRARSPEHDAAWREAAELHGMAGQVLSDQSAGAGGAMPSRRVVLGGVAGLAVAAGAALHGPEAWLRLRADRVTATAEVARFQLADGTGVVLGPASAIRLAPGGGIDLLEGAVCIDMAPGGGRPFEAAVGGLAVRASDAAFSLSRESGSLTLGAERGSLAVTTPPGAFARVGPGEWLRLDEATGRLERGRLLPGQFAAWRQGQLVAEDETVAAVVAQIRRWHAGRIVVAAPGLGARRISGVFDLNSPLLALEAVLHPFAARIRHLPPWLTVVSAI